MKEKEHHFLANPEYFNNMKNSYLLRVKEELSRLKISFLHNLDSNNFQKEISLYMVCFLLRKCIELELIKEDTFLKIINSIIHSHYVAYYDNGSLNIKSDFDMNKKREGVLINIEFIELIEKKVDKYLKTDIK
ncbi:MAG: hypothetical protein V4666_01470 [Bacteroidota bacterium]